MDEALQLSLPLEIFCLLNTILITMLNTHNTVVFHEPLNSTWWILPSQWKGRVATPQTLCFTLFCALSNDNRDDPKFKCTEKRRAVMSTMASKGEWNLLHTVCHRLGSLGCRLWEEFTMQGAIRKHPRDQQLCKGGRGRQSPGWAQQPQPPLSGASRGKNSLSVAPYQQVVPRRSKWLGLYTCLAQSPEASCLWEGVRSGRMHPRPTLRELTAGGCCWPLPEAGQQVLLWKGLAHLHVHCSQHQ